MRLTEFHVEGYKPIESDGFESIDDLAILIGKNDAGKSSFLEAIKIFLEEKGKPSSSHFHMNNTKEITFSGQFTDVPDRLSKKLTDSVDTSDGTLRIERCYKHRENKSPKRTTYIGDEEEKLSKGTVVENGDELYKAESRERIWSYLPEPIYIPAERDISEQTKFKSDTWLDRLLSPLLTNNDALDTKREELEEELEEEIDRLAETVENELTEQTTSISKVNFDPGSINLGKAFTPSISVEDDSSETPVPIEERGSGVGSMFVLSFVEAYRERSTENKYFLLFEEPGVWLHPEAKRKMLGTIRKVAQSDDQVMLSTHSPIFIDRRGEGNLYSVQREEGKTSVDLIQEDYLSIVEDLGLRNSDLLQSDFVIYTEGPSDANILKVVAREYLDNWDKMNISIQHLGGTGNIDKSDWDDLREINQNFAILLDSDKKESGQSPSDKASKIKEACENVGGFAWILDKREIENYFSSVGINKALSLNVDDGFVGDYEDMEEKIADARADEYEGLSSESRKEQCKECGSVRSETISYPKNKGPDIVEEMYDAGEEIQELQEFLDKVKKNVKADSVE